MRKERTFLVDVGIADLRFPVIVPSGRADGGQHTVASISIRARIMREIEADWMDRFIRVTHERREALGPEGMDESLRLYAEALSAKSVRLELRFPYFAEKWTPKSKEKCLVEYDCRYAGRYPSLDDGAKVRFGARCPVVTSSVLGLDETPTTALPQLSMVDIEVEPRGAFYPETIVELVDQAGLAPVYSYLPREDRVFLMERMRGRYRPSVEMVDELHATLSGREDIAWYSIEMVDHDLLHSYTAHHSLEKSLWVPGSFREHGDA